MYFKYGSTGNEQNVGIPYWIWRVLPDLFPEYIPGTGNYAEFGFTWGRRSTNADRIDKGGSWDYSPGRR